MSLTLIGKKRGMTRLFDSETQTAIPCTVIEVDPNVVSQVKTQENDGYRAIQLAAFSLNSAEKKRARKPDLGLFQKKNVEPKKVLRETRVGEKDHYEVGQTIDVTAFQEGSFVDVQGMSKGRGYQGVIKRHGKGRIATAHGAGPVVRHIGSAGSIRAHGRVHKNKKMAGHMGDENVTIECLKVIKVDPELKVLVVKGAIPGANGKVVFIRSAVKK